MYPKTYEITNQHCNCLPSGVDKSYGCLFCDKSTKFGMEYTDLLSFQDGYHEKIGGEYLTIILNYRIVGLELELLQSLHEHTILIFKLML